jgi:hypothetical protein
MPVRWGGRQSGRSERRKSHFAIVEANTKRQAEAIYREKFRDASAGRNVSVTLAKQNPLKIGKWIRAKIKRLRNGSLRVEVPGYGLPYGVGSKNR